MDYCLYLIVIIVSVVNGVPQIFERNYQFCEYNFTNGHHLRVPGKFWKISKSGSSIQYNLCPYEPLKECRNATSCFSRNKPKQMIKLGTHFVPVDGDDMMLESINGEECLEDPTIRYKLTVNLICTNSMKFEPRLLIIDDCNYEIQMLSPVCQPKCTGLIDDQYLLDLRQFPKNLELINDDNRKFSLSICGSNNHCGSSDISSCELLNHTSIPLAKTDSQLINYDVSKGELTARGRYKLGKISRDVQILIKCNWNKTLTNLKYKKLQIQGRHYKFELESTYGCIKLPQNCYLNNFDGLKYNLQQLYRPKNNWIVQNTPIDYGRIILNLCGPLSQQLNNKNQCSDQYSQICRIKSGKYTNLGSLPRYEIDSYGIIKVTINDGNRCDDNQQINYKTIILLKCSTIELGPIYKNYNNCTIFIEWLTPIACPLQYYDGDHCLVNDHYSPRNLQQLYQQIDKIHILNSNNKIIYNLCGPIHQNCSNYNSVSFCLLTRNQQQYVLGWDTRKLISDYGQLRLDLHGDLCPNQRDSSRILINFICDYNEPPPKIDIIQDNCKLNLTIFTKLACLTDGNFDNCQLSTSDNGNCYDLSPLIRKNHNYIINDGDYNYILNLCGPIITNRQALCKKNTMLCMYNKTETNIKQQFKSIGSVIGPQFKNNSLTIDTIGDYCPGYGFYKSQIIFQCTTKDESPKLLQNDQCSYLFLWKTRYACPTKQCYIPNTSINLKDLKNTKLEIDLENSLINRFDLCEDYYMECYNNNSRCIEKQLQRQITIKESIVNVELNLNRNCSLKSNDFHIVIFKILCDDTFVNNEHFENESLNDCILTQTIRTQLICSLNNNNNNNTITNTSSTTIKEEILTNESHHYYTNIENCLITTDNNNRPIYLNNLPGFSTIFSSTKYTINLNQTIQNCFGLFCMNDTVIVPFATNCPNINRIDNKIHLEFLTGTVCQDNLIYYSVDMILKCGDYGLEMIKNINCRIQYEYSLPSICQQVATNYSSIIGGIIGVCIVLIAVVLIYKLRRQYCRNRQYLDLTALHPFYVRDCDD